MAEPPNLEASIVKIHGQTKGSCPCQRRGSNAGEQRGVPEDTAACSDRCGFLDPRIPGKVEVSPMKRWGFQPWFRLQRRGLSIQRLLSTKCRGSIALQYFFNLAVRQMSLFGCGNYLTWDVCRGHINEDPGKSSGHRKYRSIFGH